MDPGVSRALAAGARFVRFVWTDNANVIRAKAADLHGTARIARTSARIIRRSSSRRAAAVGDSSSC